MAFVGRLHPVGIVFSAILMSMFYIGGELAQSRLGLPEVIDRRIPGAAAVHLLACDTLMRTGSKPRASVEAMMVEQFALLIAATLNAGTVLAIAGWVC